ncbi:MAG: radical SAM protein [Halanaerobiales bacterium]
MKYLYGPVPSRRLGVSLGIDLIPYKICSFNCIYCECGETTNLTNKREEFKPVDLIIEELDEYLKKKPELDYITFSGSGEPTLYKAMGKIIDYLKENYSEYNLALLTNSSLLIDKKVRNEIKDIDLIVPSLDSVLEENFEKINRPHKDIQLNQIIDGLIEFSKVYDGKMYLEVFIVPGINDTNEEFKKLKNIIEKIQPNRVQFNTLDRPGTEEWVEPASEEKLKEALDIIGKKAEIIGRYDSDTDKKSIDRTVKEKIIDIIKRRPCTVRDLSNIFDLHVNEVNKYLRELDKEHDLKIKNEKRGRFYFFSEEE